MVQGHAHLLRAMPLHRLGGFRSDQRGDLPKLSGGIRIRNRKLIVCAAPAGFTSNKNALAHKIINISRCCIL